jgi:hypothetical protein
MMHKIREESEEKNSLLDRHIACICLQTPSRSSSRTLGMGHDGFGVDYGVIGIFESLGGTRLKMAKFRNGIGSSQTPCHWVKLTSFQVYCCAQSCRQNLRTPQNSSTTAGPTSLFLLPFHCRNNRQTVSQSFEPS